MKYFIKAKNNKDFIDHQTYNQILPLIVALDLSTLYQMSEEQIIRRLDLKNVDGVETQKTNYILQLDEVLSPYSNNKNEQK